MILCSVHGIWSANMSPKMSKGKIMFHQKYELKVQTISLNHVVFSSQDQNSTRYHTESSKEDA